MFFLEILSSTKPAVGKEGLDIKLGNWVNGSVTGIFMTCFAFIGIFHKEKSTVLFLNNFLSMANPYDTALTGSNPTWLLIGQTLNSIILLCHANIALLIARESVLIHKDEMDNKFMSQMLDRQVYLNIDSQNFVTSDGDEQNVNSNGGQTDNRETLDNKDGGENRHTDKSKNRKHRLSYMKLD
jgi:hypothetical protein